MPLIELIYVDEMAYVYVYLFRKYCNSIHYSFVDLGDILKKGELIEGIVEGIDFPNKAYFRVDGKKVVLKNAIIGQQVCVRIKKIRKDKIEANLYSIIRKSGSEVDSPCVHFGMCGGCSYQQLPYEEQLRLKEGQVKKIIDEVYIARDEKPDEEYIFDGIKASPVQYEYRNKMEFSFGDAYKDGPLSLGMHKRGSYYDIVNVSECVIVDEDYRLILECVLEYFTNKEASYYHRMRHQGFLRHLVVRKAKRTGEILIAIITSTQNEVDVDELKDIILDMEKTKKINGKIAGILHVKNDSLADVVSSDEMDILYGKDYFYEEILGLRFKISLFSFFQTNSLGAEVLYETARDYIGKLDNPIIYDLYSGTGTIAQMLSPIAKKVIGVEIVEDAVKAARVNTTLNGIENCEFIAGDVLKVLDDIEEKPDFIVLDPPRDGIHPKALPKIIEYGVDRIIYISCKPTSLARDLEVFLQNGYKVDRVVCVDMFPGTVHVETVALLSKLNVDHYIEVELNMDELDLTSSESKATYEEIKAYVLENSGLKVTNLYIAQIKQKCGIIERTNYNVSKKDDTRVPQCPKDKEVAIMDALRHFGMLE